VGRPSGAARSVTQGKLIERLGLDDDPGLLRRQGQYSRK
jgi:hypothetical protein